MSLLTPVTSTIEILLANDRLVEARQKPVPRSAENPFEAPFSIDVAPLNTAEPVSNIHEEMRFRPMTAAAYPDVAHAYSSPMKTACIIGATAVTVAGAILAPVATVGVLAAGAITAAYVYSPGLRQKTVGLCSTLCSGGCSLVKETPAAVRWSWSKLSDLGGATYRGTLAAASWSKSKLASIGDGTIRCVQHVPAIVGSAVVAGTAYGLYAAARSFV
jgi:hypothetical protein